MITGVWGKKIGMTQVFFDDKVVPVTVIDLAYWVVTNIKTVERDGYSALQVGHIRPRYAQKKFSFSWLQKPKKHFVFLREIKTSASGDSWKIGSPVSCDLVLTNGISVDVTGITRGHGFAGVVKRHGFTGGPASHGAKMGKAPGAASHLRACGKVIKGKRYPGHLGAKQQTTKKLKVVQVHCDKNIVLVNGAVPGKTGSLVYIKKV
jgi:large subunit ribosomal protein L3